MTGPQRATLYSPAMLALAVELAAWPYDPAMPLHGHARSRSCGSVIACSARGTDVLEDFGLRVTACAVGQAAAALFARSARGRTRADLELALTRTTGWLGTGGARPDWPGIELLDPALAHPGRHEAILLPWRAAIDALCKERIGG